MLLALLCQDDIAAPWKLKRCGVYGSQNRHICSVLRLARAFLFVVYVSEMKCRADLGLCRLSRFFCPRTFLTTCVTSSRISWINYICQTYWHCFFCWWFSLIANWRNFQKQYAEVLTSLILRWAHQTCYVCCHGATYSFSLLQSLNAKVVVGQQIATDHLLQNFFVQVLMAIVYQISWASKPQHFWSGIWWALTDWEYCCVIHCDRVVCGHLHRLLKLTERERWERKTENGMKDGVSLSKCPARPGQIASQGTTWKPQNRSQWFAEYLELDVKLCAGPKAGNGSWGATRWSSIYWGTSDHIGTSILN